MRGSLAPRQLGMRIHSKLLFIPASLSFLLAMRRRTRTELWIGDSHAMSFNRDIVSSMFMRGADGQLIVRAGARVMWSIAKNGFPPRVVRIARLANKLARPGSLVPVFSAGEIDVRAHLAERPEDGFEFVSAYVEQCTRIAQLLKAERSAYVVPPPPCDMRGEDVWYPIVGTMEQRIAAFNGLRDALVAAVDRVPGAELIDFTETLADSTGGLSRELTDDGCHTNADAIPLIREQVGRYELLVR